MIRVQIQNRWNAFFAALIFVLDFVSAILGSAPTAVVKNGTYLGRYVPEWQQDHFLGIPYAQAPVGSLRFARPRSLNTTFNGTKSATTYGYSCYQYGTNFDISEDCLNLNGGLSILVVQTKLTIRSNQAFRYCIFRQAACTCMDLWRWFLHGFDS